MNNGSGNDNPTADPAFFAAMRDPIKFARVLWPDVRFYAKQQEIIYSVEYNAETYVPAGNKLGKDFVAGFIALRTFLTYREVRVITTSVKDDHLRVLWGEIGRFIQSAAIPLTADKGGPLILNHRDVRKLKRDPLAGGNGLVECKISYLRGMVSERGEGMAGHHAAMTLVIIDEASGVDDVVYTQGATWAKRMLFIGNPNACENFFRRGVEAGDLARLPARPYN